MRNSAVGVLAHEHHVHGHPPAALLDEPLLAGREHVRLAPPHLEVLEEDPEALGVDPDAVAHGFELPVALHRARMVEAQVPRDER